MAECKGSSTKQLKQCLGFWDLMGASVGQIIGAGIMTLLGAAISMTGRSVPVAFLIAAVITICQYAPLVFIAGTVRLRGGGNIQRSLCLPVRNTREHTVLFLHFQT